MSKNESIPTWYWVLAILLLLWNIMGVGSFYIHTFVSEEALLAMPDNERALYGSYPLWTKIVFAIAVFGGLLGAIGLVMRKKWARPAFIISIMAIIPQMVHSLFFTNSREVYGPGTEIIPIIVILIGLFLVWFSGYVIKRGWLN